MLVTTNTWVQTKSNLKLRRKFYKTTTVKGDLIISRLWEIFFLFCLLWNWSVSRMGPTTHYFSSLPYSLPNALSLSLVATSLFSLIPHLSLPSPHYLSKEQRPKGQEPTTPPPYCCHSDEAATVTAMLDDTLISSLLSVSSLIFLALTLSPFPETTQHHHPITLVN